MACATAQTGALGCQSWVARECKTLIVWARRTGSYPHCCCCCRCCCRYHWTQTLRRHDHSCQSHEPPWRGQPTGTEAQTHNMRVRSRPCTLMHMSCSTTLRLHTPGPSYTDTHHNRGPTSTASALPAGCGCVRTAIAEGVRMPHDCHHRWAVGTPQTHDDQGRADSSAVTAAQYTQPRPLGHQPPL